MQISLPVRCLSRWTAAFATLAVLGGAAQAAETPPKNAGGPPKEVVLQVDGITDRVIDNLWTKSDAFWHEGDYQRIIALIRVCVAADPSFVEAYSNGAWLLWSMGDSDGADALLADGEKRSPKKGDIAYEYGYQLFRTKRYPEAAKYLKRSVEGGGQPAPVYTTYAHALEKLNRWDEAEKVWQQVVKKFPTFVAGPPNLKRVRETISARNVTPPGTGSK